MCTYKSALGGQFERNIWKVQREHCCHNVHTVTCHRSRFPALANPQMTSKAGAINKWMSLKIHHIYIAYLTGRHQSPWVWSWRTNWLDFTQTFGERRCVCLHTVGSHTEMVISSGELCQILAEVFSHCSCLTYWCGPSTAVRSCLSSGCLDSRRAWHRVLVHCPVAKVCTVVHTHKDGNPICQSSCGRHAMMKKVIPSLRNGFTSERACMLPACPVDTVHFAVSEQPSLKNRSRADLPQDQKPTHTQSCGVF